MKAEGAEVNVYTGGTFDLLHPGHIELLKACKAIAEQGGWKYEGAYGTPGMVIVGLNIEQFVVQYKGKAPVQTYEERQEMLLACKYVDMVLPNGGYDSRGTIIEARLATNTRPSELMLVAVGEDWANRDYYKQMSFDQKWLDDNHIQVVYIPRTTRFSTTMLRQKNCPPGCCDR